MYKMGQYIHGDSFVHSLDPRVKVSSVIALSIMILKGDVLIGATIGIFLLFLILISRLALRHLFEALRPMLFFLALLFSLHLFFTGGTPIPPFPSWHVTITYEGLYKGALITWQFMLLILSASILTMTTSPSEMVRGIEGLLRPLRMIKIPSHDIAIMVSIALRFMPTLLEEIDRIREAQMARGVKLKTGTLVQRVKATTFLLIPIIQSCFHRADALATAMQSRCYKRGPRTYMNDLRISWKDCLFMGVIILIAGLYSLKSYMASVLFKIGFLF